MDIVNLPSAYVHHLNPFAIQFWEGVGIRWYGLAYLAGFYAGFLVIQFMVKRGLSTLPFEQVGDFVFCVAFGTIIGGRLGYCLFYSPNLFSEFSNSFPFWGVLAINKGGMASHGGIAGIVIACWYYARRYKSSALHLMDLTTIGGTIGIFFGRIANFINGELVGRPVQSAISWAVKFPQDILAWPERETDKLLALGPIVEKLQVPASDWTTWVQSYAWNHSAYQRVESVLLEIVRQTQIGNRELISALAPLLSARHPSQLYEALLEGLFLCICLLLIWRVPRKPGIITGCFLSLYSLVRIIGEQFRMPDIQIGYQLFGLTRGQWLSIGMLILGLTCLEICRRRDGPLLGGWKKSSADTAQN